MNAIGPQTHAELVRRLDALPRRRRRARRGAHRRRRPRVLRRRRPEGELPRRRGDGVARLLTSARPRARRARGPPGPVALDRPAQADDRRGQRRRVRRRAGVGVLDGPGGRRRARDLRRDLPALERRPGRRRHAAPAADRRLPPRDGADPHRARDRRRRGARDRPGQRGRPDRDVRASARWSSPEQIAALPQPAIRTDHEAVVRGWASRWPRACGSRRSASTACSTRPRSWRACARFNERDHPDRAPGGGAQTAGLRRG